MQRTFKGKTDEFTLILSCPVLLVEYFCFNGSGGGRNGVHIVFFVCWMGWTFHILCIC